MCLEFFNAFLGLPLAWLGLGLFAVIIAAHNLTPPIRIWVLFRISIFVIMSPFYSILLRLFLSGTSAGRNR